MQHASAVCVFSYCLVLQLCNLETRSTLQCASLPNDPCSKLLHSGIVSLLLQLCDLGDVLELAGQPVEVLTGPEGVWRPAKLIHVSHKKCPTHLEHFLTS